MAKYTVSMAITGRVDIEVEADNPEAAKKKAYAAFGDADLNQMEFVDATVTTITET